MIPEPQMGELIAELKRRGYDADAGVVIGTLSPGVEKDENGLVVIRGEDGEEIGREDLSASRAWRRACH